MSPGLTFSRFERPLAERRLPDRPPHVHGRRAEESGGRRASRVRSPPRRTRD